MLLGEGCVYKLQINGQEKVFNSEQELDAFLLSNLDSFVQSYSNIFYSIDLQQSALKELEQAKVDIASSQVEIIRGNEDPEEADIYYKIPNSIGVTKFNSTFGDPNDWSKPINVPFNKIDFRNRSLERGRANGKTDMEINAELDETIDVLWPELTDMGTEIHAIMEAVFSEKEIPKTKWLPDSTVLSIVQQAKQFRSELKLRHGDDAIILPEFAFKSKKLNPQMLELMKLHNITSINGKADLLVVDKTGGVFIYDYKVSRKDFGTRNDWNIESNKERATLGLVTSSKKRNIATQLAMYHAILRQYNLNVKSCNIVPIKLDIEYTDDTKQKIAIDENGKLRVQAKIQDVISRIPQTMSGQFFDNASRIVPPPFETTSEKTASLIQTTKQIFPNAELSGNVKHFEATREYFKTHPEVIDLKRITRDSPLYGKYKWTFKTTGLSKARYIKCETDEELEHQLNDYILALNSHNATELRNLADNIYEAISGSIPFANIADDFDENKRTFVKYQFKKYINDNWDFVNDKNLVSAGIFIFKKDGVAEIVVLSNKQLLQKVNLGMGTSLLGKTTENAYINSKEILDANYGNIEIMKAMLYVSQNQDLFKNFKIAEIRAVNPWNKFNKQVTNINSAIIHNWNMICMNNPDLKLQQVSNDIFWDDVTAELSIAYSLLSNEDQSYVDFELVPSAPDKIYDAQWIESKIAALRSRYNQLANPESYNPDDDVWQAYVYLYKALLACKNIYMLNEGAAGEMFTGKGINPNGFLISAGQFSPSANIRLFSEIHDQYVSDVRNEIIKRGRKMIMLLEKFYKEAGQNDFIGINTDIFKSWIRTTPTGEIDEQFLFKNPYSKDFDGTPAAREALIEMITVLYKLKHNNLTEATLDAEIKEKFENDDLDLFEIPLTEAAFSRQAKSLSFWQALKNKWAEAKNLYGDAFAEDEKRPDKGTMSLREKSGFLAQKVYNKFRLDSETRRTKLQEHKIGFFETNLEIVFNQALESYCRENMSKKYVPIFQGMRLSLQYMQGYGQQKIDNIISTFDKMLKSKFYGEPIMSEDLQPIWRYLNVLKRGFSIMTLGINFGSMFRELLQGTFVGLSRSGVRMLEGLDVRHYLAGAGHVIKEAGKNFSGVSLLQQLNMQYGIANMSLSNIAKQRKLGRHGIRNWSTDTLFWTSASPDFQHRMSVLVGKMMADGSWEAHSLDADGNLVYDWTKDKRFEAYVNNKTDDKNYLYQKSLYLNYIREFNRIGYKKADGSEFKEGDALPMAYPPKEQQAIKNFSDLLYGHYDDESRALINDTFLGSFFMQYKTFITAKLEQWTMHPGVYNTEMLKQQYDPVYKNEKLYVKVSYPNADNTGIPVREIVRESQLTEEDKKSGNVEAYLRWEGMPMEGMWQSTMSFLSKAKHLDGKAMHKLWKNPLKKANFCLMLNDLILATLAMLILNALFGISIGSDEWWSRDKVRREIRDENWLTQWGYKVSLGAFSDGPITAIVSQLLSDVNPPLISSVTKLVDTTGKLIIGDVSLATAITSNFGALREFQGLTREWDEARN